MLAPPSQSPLPSRRLNGRHVLMALLAFFGVVFAVNGTFLYSAISSHSGVVAQEPYRKGLQYNLRIAEADRQLGLRWRATVTWQEGARGIVLSVAQSDGAPVTGLAFTGVVGRPSTGREDIVIEMRESGPGTYAARFDPPGPGAWLASLEATVDADGQPIPYRIRKRLWLQP